MAQLIPGFSFECPELGEYPDCTCKLPNATYIKSEYKCVACPDHGKYPDCYCDHPFQYNNEMNLCVECPENSAGIYPNCECKNFLFSTLYGECIECPENSSGIYPNCKYEVDRHEFSAYINECYIACPVNSVRFALHPFCKCSLKYYYDANEFICKFIDRAVCPLDSIGVAPDCTCVQENYKFSSDAWVCYLPVDTSEFDENSCPNRYEKWPQCGITIDGRLLETLIG